MSLFVGIIRSAFHRIGIHELPFPIFLARLPFVKHALLRLDIFKSKLERLNIVDYWDKVRCRSPLYHRQILFNQEGHDRIAALISSSKPLMVSRLGAMELICLQFYLKERGRREKPYPQNITFCMSNNAGFFPADNRSLDAFVELYLEELKQVDAMGVWFNHYEAVICNTFCPNADLVELRCLEPFHFTKPWSSGLTGRKVLVVHPFVESIRKQYTEKRQLLFADPDVLPEFELKTLKGVQSIAGTKVSFTNWFDACHYMCDEMSRIDFDICIIGAGAYGLPLASFAKKLGKQAIHMGGSTQILFGIKGKRWEEEYRDTTAKLFNEHWVRPLPSETPSNKDKVEEGCYW